DNNLRQSFRQVPCEAGHAPIGDTPNLRTVTLACIQWSHPPLQKVRTRPFITSIHDSSQLRPRAGLLPRTRDASGKWTS
ncbi:hypothetical protein BaRGS_00035295, partial [Batillaria attramentaria]